MKNENNTQKDIEIEEIVVIHFNRLEWIIFLFDKIF